MTQFIQNVSDKPLPLVTARGGDTPVTGSLRIKIGENALIVTLSGDWLQVIYKGTTGWILKGNNPITGEGNPEQPPPVDPPPVPTPAPVPEVSISAKKAIDGSAFAEIETTAEHIKVNVNGVTVWER